MEKRLACLSEIQKASGVWPESVLPLASVMVPLTITGKRCPRLSSSSSIPNSAALALRVSKTVSTKSKSTPPSKRPRVCSRYASFNSSKCTARNSGRSTSGDKLAVLLVGPMLPATNRGLCGSLAVYSSATVRARAALWRLSS